MSSDAPFTRSGQRLLALAAAILGLATASPAQAESPEAQRIVSIGGSLTEIVYALGEEDRLVGRDSTSLYPPAARALPDVGYIRQLSPEGVLSVDPDLILALEGFGPPEAVAVLKQSGLPLIEITDGFDAAAILDKIRAVGAALGKEEAAEKLAGEVGTQLDAVKARADAVEDKRSVLFVLSTQGGRVLAAGRNTHADGIIKLAGGINVMDDFEGYKPVSNEAIISAAPDVILRMSRSGEHASDEEVRQNPAIAATPAGRSGNIVSMDGLLMLGFGPRTAAAATQLGKALYGAAEGHE